MAAQPSSALTMRTACFAAEHMEASARRTGFVKRAAKMTGKRFLALVTFGVWSAAPTSLAQWAAQVTPWDAQRERSPEAMDQRLHQGALALLQDLIRPALAKVHVREKGCEDGLLPGFPTVSLAARTGFALPDRLQALVPGSGGRAATAGATMQAVWAYTSRVVEHFALTPGPIPEQTSIAPVVAWAHKGILLLLDWGYFQIKACARIAAAGAYFFSRLNPQAHLLHAEPGRLQPLELASLLTTVTGNGLEKPLCLGAKERVACRLVAARGPESMVHARRRLAKKKAKKKG